MSQQEIETCLTHLRAADDMLMVHNEMAIAVHLALVIELLEEREAMRAAA